MCERYINQLPLAYPQLGTRPATQTCALVGNRTDDPVVRRPALNPLSHTSHGCFWFLNWLFWLCEEAKHVYLLLHLGRWFLKSESASYFLLVRLCHLVSGGRVAISNKTFSYLLFTLVGGTVFLTSLVTNDTEMCGLHGEVTGCQVIIP